MCSRIAVYSSWAPSTAVADPLGRRNGKPGLQNGEWLVEIGAGTSPDHEDRNQRIGHADVGVTLTVNAHVMPGDDEDAARCADSLLADP